MMLFDGYEIDESNLIRRRIKCTIAEFNLLTKFCANLNENEKTCEEFISRYPNFELSHCINNSTHLVIIIEDDYIWGWDEVDDTLGHLEFSEIAKSISSYSSSITEKISDTIIPLELKQGTIVRATRNNGDNSPYIWQGVYFGYCNDKHFIDFNGTHCMVADEVEVVPTLSKKEAKQKVSELFANNGKNVSSQKIREIIDLIELDGCNKEEK